MYIGTYIRLFYFLTVLAFLNVYLPSTQILLLTLSKPFSQFLKEVNYLSEAFVFGASLIAKKFSNHARIMKGIFFKVILITINV